MKFASDMQETDVSCNSSLPNTSAFIPTATTEITDHFDRSLTFYWEFYRRPLACEADVRLRTCINSGRASAARRFQFHR